MIRVGVVFRQRPNGGKAVVQWDPFLQTLECLRCRVLKCEDVRAFAYAHHTGVLGTTVQLPHEGVPDGRLYDVQALRHSAANDLLEKDDEFRSWTRKFCLTDEGIRDRLFLPEITDEHCSECGEWASECTCEDEEPGFPIDDAPACPKCRRTMVARTSRRGNLFWGCPGFPRCDGSRPFDDLSPPAAVMNPPPPPPRADPIAEQFQRVVPARTEAERCIRMGCRTARVPGRSFCAEHEPPASGAAPSPGKARERDGAPHKSHAMEGRACRVCKKSGADLKKPCGRPELGRMGMIELD